MGKFDKYNKKSFGIKGIISLLIVVGAILFIIIKVFQKFMFRTTSTIKNNLYKNNISQISSNSNLNNNNSYKMPKELKNKANPPKLSKEFIKNVNELNKTIKKNKL
jgi:hypothetical protein